MAPILDLDRKACTACAQAKRKCGKQSPRCGRCEERGLRCSYPYRKQPPFVIYRPGSPATAEATPPASCTADGLACLDLSMAADGVVDTLDALIPATSSPSPVLDSQDVWFLAPETWKITHIPHVDEPPHSNVVLKRYTQRIRRWLSQWVAEGSNPFIHSQLYKHSYPRCIQDAYSALSCYLFKHPANEEAVFRLLEERVEQLMEDNPPGPRPGASPRTLDTFDHISRVHCLIVYQTLCLYDGDIRLRGLGERHIPILDQWTREMVESAARISRLGCFLNQTLATAEVSTPHYSVSRANGEEALWRAWILAETVRRTWSVGGGIQSVYIALQRGWAPCPGGMMSTTRQGVWDASSAFSWARLCSEVNVGFMYREATERLFVDAKTEDVDPFGKSMMEITYGVEKMERWGVDITEAP